MTTDNAAAATTGGSNPEGLGGERGFVFLIALIATVIPLLLIVGAASQTMLARQSRLEAEIRDERALIAAESGIDEAIYQASTSAGLSSGVPITRDLGGGMVFTVTPTFLRTDGVDNDGDSVVDEADENMFQILVSGTFGGRARRLVAYLGPEPSIGSLPGALTMLDPFSGSELHIQGSSHLDGHDYNMDGTAGDPASDTYGAMISTPYTKAQLLANIPSGDRSKVLGIGPGNPSIEQTAFTLDLAATKLAIQNSANVVLTSGSYNNLQFGNGQAGTFNVIYRNGSVDFKGNTHGAGIMFINGHLHTEGRFQFDGIIYVTGDVEMHGNAGSGIYGGVVVGATSPHFYLEGNMEIRYSTEAISGATAVMPGKYLAFNGWQEISRQ